MCASSVLLSRKVGKPQRIEGRLFFPCVAAQIQQVDSQQRFFRTRDHG